MLAEIGAYKRTLSMRRLFVDPAIGSLCAQMRSSVLVRQEPLIEA